MTTNSPTVFKLRKSVAGKPVPRYAKYTHKVTPVGQTEVKSYRPFLELVNTTTGIRYALVTLCSRLAQQFKAAFELGALDELDYQVTDVTMGRSTFQAIVLNTEDGPMPIFKVGKVFGVVNTFRDNLCEALSRKRSIRTMDALLVASANKLGITPRELVGKDPSPFPEFKEAGYGSRFHMCSEAVAAAYRKQAAKLKS